MDWNRDAIPAEMAGFDCSKGHPAMGNYHHHQNPSAFKLDLNVISTICNLYDADGLYTIDSTSHSPLIGFAYDGFPIYGAYGFKNADGSGGITRIKSSYQLRNITQRTHAPDGTDVPDGPAVGATQSGQTFSLGYFREDYEYVQQASEDFLDEHNGRFCVTPEYPNGTYAYFATVDSNWNSAYPYVVGPTFYGNYSNRKITSINESTSVYTVLSIEDIGLNSDMFNVTVNTSSEIISVQILSMAKVEYTLRLSDISGRIVGESTLKQGSTFGFFDTQTLYGGAYFVSIIHNGKIVTKKVLIKR